MTSERITVYIPWVNADNLLDSHIFCCELSGSRESGVHIPDYLQDKALYNTYDDAARYARREIIVLARGLLMDKVLQKELLKLELEEAGEQDQLARQRVKQKMSRLNAEIISLKKMREAKIPLRFPRKQIPAHTATHAVAVNGNLRAVPSLIES